LSANTFLVTALVSANESHTEDLQYSLRPQWANQVLRWRGTDEQGSNRKCSLCSQLQFTHWAPKFSGCISSTRYARNCNQSLRTKAFPVAVIKSASNTRFPRNEQTGCSAGAEPVNDNSSSYLRQKTSVYNFAHLKACSSTPTKIA
jgi:hypothetical protein